MKKQYNIPAMKTFKHSITFITKPFDHYYNYTIQSDKLKNQIINKKLQLFHHIYSETISSIIDKTSQSVKQFNKIHY